MKRREFIASIAAIVAFPKRPLAQQKRPVIGFLNHRARRAAGPIEAALRTGLKEAGFVEGENVSIEYRYSEGRQDRLPELVADLTNRRVDLLVAGGSTPAVAAKNATDTIPIFFFSGGDAVELGLVQSLSRPGGNATGISQVSHSLGPKRLELLKEVVSPNEIIVVILHAGNVSTPSDVKEVEGAARAIGRPIKIAYAANADDLDHAFGAVGRDGAVLVGAGAFFSTHMQQLVRLAARHKVPTMFAGREFVEAGGLMSYGPSITDSYRQVGRYAGRVLKGEKPAELPVAQPTKFELIINLRVGKELGIDAPATLLARADEVIE